MSVLWGITPALAGKSDFLVVWVVQPKDHPRVGGEKFWALLSRLPCVGSPPRWRGKDPMMTHYKVSTGITPALAGKSEGCRWPLPCDGDHPRVGGEKAERSRRLQLLQESPPRWRGKAAPLYVVVLNLGITPALAGKRGWIAASGNAGVDHPRVGGEKPNRILWDSFKRGSPPRWRGKASTALWYAVLLRITPALAGKSGARAHSGPCP